MAATDELDATLLELDSEFERTLAALSPTQRRRALMRGSLAEMIASARTYTHQVDPDGVRVSSVEVSLAEKALETLGSLLMATKFVVAGNAATEVPDNDVRLSAAVRILEFSDTRAQCEDVA